MHITLAHVSVYVYRNYIHNGGNMFKTTKQSAIDWQITKDSKPFAWVTNSKTNNMYVVTFIEFDGEYKGFRNFTEAKAFATNEVKNV